MLHTRINLLREYLFSVSSDPSSESYISPSHTVLRSVKALTLSRLNLILPPSLEGNTALSSLNIESIQEENEVRLVALMGTLLKSVKELQMVSKKFSVLESGRSMFEQGGPQAMGFQRGFYEGRQGGRYGRRSDD